MEFLLFLTLLYISVDRCPPIPRGLHSTASSVLTPVGAVIHYRCDTGHEHSGGSRLKAVLCKHDRAWNHTEVTCESKYIFQYFHL